MRHAPARIGICSGVLLGMASAALAGDLVFTSTTFPFSTGIGAAGIAAADFDGDGYLDLATVCQADVGFGGPGIAQLEVCGGDLSSGNDTTMTLSRAPQLAPAILVVSLQSNPVFVPAVGGILVPVPILFTVPATTDGNGVLSFPVPGGGGPVSVYTQWAIVDGQGWALSNAVRLDLLP